MVAEMRLALLRAVMGSRRLLLVLLLRPLLLLSTLGVTVPVVFSTELYVANQTCTYEVSDPPTNYSTWTRNQCTDLVYGLVEDEAGQPLHGLTANRDLRMRNCCPLAQEFFRCFSTSDWSDYDPPSALATMTAIAPTGCTGFFDEQVAMKTLGYNLDCPIPPPPYCFPLHNCIAEESERNFTDASGVVIAGPWPNTQMEDYATIPCASTEIGPLEGKYSGLLIGYCNNGTIEPTNSSCIPNPCGVNGGEIDAGFDASGIKIWGPWPAVTADHWSYIECHPYVGCRLMKISPSWVGMYARGTLVLLC